MIRGKSPSTGLCFTLLFLWFCFILFRLVSFCFGFWLPLGLYLWVRFCSLGPSNYPHLFSDVNPRIHKCSLRLRYCNFSITCRCICIRQTTYSTAVFPTRGLAYITARVSFMPRATGMVMVSGGTEDLPPPLPISKSI